jgi:hypothetical protein
MQIVLYYFTKNNTKTSSIPITASVLTTNQPMDDNVSSSVWFWISQLVSYIVLLENVRVLFVFLFYYKKTTKRDDNIHNKKEKKERTKTENK